MGNSTSNAHNTRPSSLHPRSNNNSPARRSPRPHDPLSNHPLPNSALAPHRSLRTKKKSLELPDLASLGLTSANPQNSPYHRVSHPINIPTTPNGAPPRGRHHPDFASTQHMSDVAIGEQSTHIPVNHNRSRGGGGGGGGGSGTYFRGAQYEPTRGFVDTTAARAQRIPALNHPPPPPSPPRFVQETVHSTIPIALGKAAAPTDNGTSDGHPPQALQPQNDDPVAVKISWHGGGKSVVLARAGDDDWKGRQPMQRESPTSDTYTTSVSLLPGTHHIRFLVDDQWRVADDLPTAVDDEGTLANYVAVALTNTPPTASTIPNTPIPPTTLSSTPAPPPKPHQPGQSFWSSTSDADASEDAHSTYTPPTTHTTPSHHHAPPRWTSTFPPELIEAAREEEAYLQASQQSHSHTHTNGFVPAPNIPPAPGLPRHLDKLILNVKSPGVAPVGGGGRGAVRSPAGSSTGGGSGGRREKSSRRRGASAGVVSPAAEDPPHSESSSTAGPSTHANGCVIPVTTASGTDLTGSSGLALSLSAPAERARLDGPGLADDASVLPVPSHVVLHHLSTSAIRNGVLAVGNTTRYRKKYLTTIYYKPT